MSKLYLGRANVDITPAVGTHLGGWQEERYSNDIHRPLSCRVLYLKQEDRSTVIVSLDVLGLSSELTNEIRNETGDRLGIEASSIIISSTHTHSGPVLPPCLMEGVPLPDLNYIHMLKDKIIGAIYLSKEQTVPVKVGYGKGDSDLAVSRRMPEADGKVGYPPQANPDGTVDNELDVIRFDSADGNVLAVLFSYGCHPTVAGPSKWIGPDYPGIAREFVESNCDEGTLAVFLLGNCADVRTNYTQENGRFAWDVSKDLVREAGVRIGAEVVKVVNQINCGEQDELKHTTEVIDIHTEKGTVADHCEFNAVRIGEVTLLTNPGECFAQIGLDLRESVDGPLMFSSITNGFLGYVPTKAAYPFGGYEVEISHKHFGLDSSIAPSGEAVFYNGMLNAYNKLGQ